MSALREVAEYMIIHGRVQNGVVVFDKTVTLPEGTAVTITVRNEPVIRVAKNQKRVEFPLVPSNAPGTLHLTNERIYEILDDEDVEALKRSWDTLPADHPTPEIGPEV